jgi:hypothetical protein
MALLTRPAAPATPSTVLPATRPSRLDAAPAHRLTLMFINDHPCDQYGECVAGWLECVHHMVINPRDVPARRAEAMRATSSGTG